MCLLLRSCVIISLRTCLSERADGQGLLRTWDVLFCLGWRLDLAIRGKGVNVGRVGDCFDRPGINHGGNAGNGMNTTTLARDGGVGIDW